MPESKHLLNLEIFIFIKLLRHLTYHVIQPNHQQVILQSLILFENIFEDLNKLVETKNDPVHTVNYEDKWIALREVVDIVFCDLQRLSIEAQNQSLNKWFREVIRSMESVEVRRNKLFISESPLPTK